VTILDINENQKNIAVLTEKISNIAVDQHNLFKSYKVLNDCHVNLERKFTIMETEWRTAKNMLNWIAGGSLLTFIISALSLLKMLKVI